MNAKEKRQIEAAALRSVLSDPDAFRRAKEGEKERDRRHRSYIDSGEEAKDRKAARFWTICNEQQKQEARRECFAHNTTAPRYAWEKWCKKAKA